MENVFPELQFEVHAKIFDEPKVENWQFAPLRQKLTKVIPRQTLSPSGRGTNG